MDACRYLGGLIVGAVNGASKDELLSEGYNPTGEKWTNSDLSPEIFDVACGSFKDREPPEKKGTGYVVQSLEAALWSFYRNDSFQSGCLAAVNLGDDADTTGAVFGQLAGVFCGVGGLPEKWLEKVAHRRLIEEYAEKLYQLGSGLAR